MRPARRPDGNWTAAAGLPERLTPLDIGVDVGTSVVVKDKEKEVTFWDGSRPVPAKEYRERVKKGELKRSARVQLAWEHNDADLARRGMTFPVPGNFYDLRPHFKIILEDTWQRRVEALIARHGLTTEQRAAVDTILRDCRSKAAKLLEQRKELLDECDEVGSRVHLTPKGEPRDKLLAHLSKVRDELSLEIHRVFETELVPRVEALLTEEQRAREIVNPPLDASSRPAAPPG